MNFFYPDWRSAATSRAHAGAVELRRAFADLEPFVEIGINPEPDEPAGAPVPDRDVIFRTRIVKETRAALEVLTAAMPQRIFSILGTCGAELAPVSWLNGQCGGDLAVVWLDAHGDVNTPKSSPSKRFHGMVLRTLLGDGDPDLTALITKPLLPAQIVPAGTRDLDLPEQEYLDSLGITPIRPAELEPSPDTLIAAVRATRRTCVYVHLDLDVLDPVEFPNVLVPAPGGVSSAALARALDALATTFDCVGASVVEYAAGDADLSGRVRELARPLFTRSR